MSEFRAIGFRETMKTQALRSSLLLCLAFWISISGPTSATFAANESITCDGFEFDSNHLEDEFDTSRAGTNTSTPAGASSGATVPAHVFVSTAPATVSKVGILRAHSAFSHTTHREPQTPPSPQPPSAPCRRMCAYKRVGEPFDTVMCFPIREAMSTFVVVAARHRVRRAKPGPSRRVTSVLSPERRRRHLL